MSQGTALETQDGQLIEQLVIHGDLAELTPKERVAYYARVCESLGLNPFTRPFEFIRLNNRLVLYARRDATDQLRTLKGVSISISSRELVEGVYTVTAKANIAERTDESIGAVDISSLRGDFRANAMMKAETKAKRRVTLSIVGLGWLDETEVKEGQAVHVDYDTGEIHEDEKDTCAIDMDWLRDALENQLQWADCGKWLRSRYGEAFGPSVKDMVKSLSKEHQVEFVAEVQKRLEQQKT